VLPGPWRDRTAAALHTLGGSSITRCVVRRAPLAGQLLSHTDGSTPLSQWAHRRGGGGGLRAAPRRPSGGQGEARKGGARTLCERSCGGKLHDSRLGSQNTSRCWREPESCVFSAALLSRTFCRETTDFADYM
jgi:hypothetical protein